MGENGQPYLVASVENGELREYACPSFGESWSVEMELRSVGHQVIARIRIPEQYYQLKKGRIGE